MTEEIDVAALHQFYHGLSELVGVEDMVKIYQQYKGMQITIPTHLYDRKLAAKRVATEYNGHNQQFLARKYGYSQKWVQRILHENNQDKERG
ncbi:Mor transcription activator family protein [Levilactobacillus spicheri]|uniref:Mor transcription activator domain-containing protein n=1 Tax=Levilactobacillus spicheri TaxID=216463 RepID=A0A0F3RVS2_9LACO|nr:Mor transcription activator family protein [Levilactobacillus spicheri]KJW13995.1 hypothetical protein VC81_00545 [Levilactobacillus spicheri]